MIVDSSALPEQVVRDVLASSFQSAGQRCSALRVLFVQEDVADRILPMLEGAMAELRSAIRCGYLDRCRPGDRRGGEGGARRPHADAWREAKLILELPLPPAYGGGQLLRAARLRDRDDLDARSARCSGRSCMSSATAPTGSTRCASDQGDRLRPHARHPQPHRDTVAESTRASKVGNTYVNRNMIGAVVGVQPFGGEGLSGTGPKAGGPHYLHRFATERTLSIDTTAAGGNASLMSMGSGERDP